MELVVNARKKLNSFILSLDFKVKDGVLGLLGKSGSGKSMALRMIAGIERPDEGFISLDGRVLFDSKRKINVPVRERRVGYLFQDYALFPNMTVFENISVSLNKREDRKKALALLERFFLMDEKDYYPHMLSGGQKQRTALARLLLSKHDILLLDEPFSALDSYLKWQLELDLMETLQEFTGPTLFVSHNRDEIYHLCDQIALIEQGVVGKVETKTELFANPKTLSAARLSGCKNFTRTYKNSDGRYTCVDWGIILEGSESQEVSQADYIGVRAHHFELVSNPERENTLSCVVRRIIEDPFSQILLLDVITAPETANFDHSKIRFEIAKNGKTVYHVSDHIFLHIPPHAVLLLENSELTM